MSFFSPAVPLKGRPSQLLLEAHWWDSSPEGNGGQFSACGCIALSLPSSPGHLYADFPWREGRHKSLKIKLCPNNLTITYYICKDRISETVLGLGFH